MKKITITIIMLFSSIYFYSQKASDVLENGIRIGSNNIIIYKYDPVNKVFKHDIARSLGDVSNPVNFKTAENGYLYLGANDKVNIYVKPVNPLNYSFTSTVEFSIDNINVGATEVLVSVGGIVAGVQKKSADFTAANKAVNNAASSKQRSNAVARVRTLSVEQCQDLDSIAIELLAIETALKKDQKLSINGIFTQLKTLDFAEETATVSEFGKINASKEAIKKHFESISTKLSDVTTSINNVDCVTINNIILKMQLQLFVQNFTNIFNEQKKRLTILDAIANKVGEAIKAYVKGGGESGLKWASPLKEVPTKKGKISSYTLKVFESGYSFSTTNEIIPSETKELASVDSKFRRFQRFVPEISAGTAYTFFKYKEYGTSTNEVGEQIVSAASENEITNLNVTSMLNLTYYIENTNVNPFWQIGVGANSEIPSLLTGFGLRGVLGSKRICISGGIAMTWIKELQNLKLGDKVDGTTTIENDLKPTFSWPPKPYIGFQYNF